LPINRSLLYSELTYIDITTWPAAIKDWCATPHKQCAVYQDHAPFYRSHLQRLRLLPPVELARFLEHLAAMVTTGNRPPEMRKVVAKLLGEISAEDQNIVLGMLLVTEWNRFPIPAQAVISQLSSAPGLRHDPAAPSGLLCGICIAWQLAQSGM
jgi:hypothetical protein